MEGGGNTALLTIWIRPASHLHQSDRTWHYPYDALTIRSRQVGSNDRRRESDSQSRAQTPGHTDSQRLAVERTVRELERRGVR